MITMITTSIFTTITTVICTIIFTITITTIFTIIFTITTIITIIILSLLLGKIMLALCQHHCKDFTCIKSLILTTAPRGGYHYQDPYFTGGELKPREGEWLSQDHPDGRWQGQDWSSDPSDSKYLLRGFWIQTGAGLATWDSTANPTLGEKMADQLRMPTLRCNQPLLSWKGKVCALP